MGSSSGSGRGRVVWGEGVCGGSIGPTKGVLWTSAWGGEAVFGSAMSDLPGWVGSNGALLPLAFFVEASCS